MVASRQIRVVPQQQLKMLPTLTGARLITHANWVQSVLISQALRPHRLGRIAMQERRIEAWGELENGKRNGWGIMILANKDKYEGCYKDGYREGYGEQINSNGDQYKGEWKNNKKNGQGFTVM